MIKKSMKIILCEPQCRGFEHVHFNAALLRTIQLAFPGSEIYFLGEEEHLRKVKAFISDVTDPADIHWQTIMTPDRMRLNWRRLAPDFRVYDAILSAAKDAEFLVFCSTTNTGILALKTLTKTMNIKTPIAAIPHGGCLCSLERFPRKVWNWPVCLQWILRLPHPDNLKFVALGKPILDTVLEKMPKARDRWCCLDLPHLKMYPAQPLPPSPPEKITFGFLGGTNLDKGFDLFFRLARELAPQFPNIEFELIGFLAESQKATDYTPYIKGISENPLSTEEYHQRFSHVTYCISTMDPKHYRWSASGTFLDMMAYVKPGLFLRNPYFENYFTRMGDIGYLVGDYNELLQTVKSIAMHFPRERYQTQVDTILRTRTIFEPQSLAPYLQNIVNKFPTPSSSRKTTT